MPIPRVAMAEIEFGRSTLSASALVGRDGEG
jgi:hypothetical protein